MTPTGGTAAIALFMDDASLRGQQAAGLPRYPADPGGGFQRFLYAFTYRDYLSDSTSRPATVPESLVLYCLSCLFCCSAVYCWNRALEPVPSYSRCSRCATVVSTALPAGSGAPLRWTRSGPARNTSEMQGQLRPLSVTQPLHRVGVALLPPGQRGLPVCNLSGLSLAARLGPLTAGYAIGFVFWVVSPTPQGIGVVEGVMALVYTSLGVPAPAVLAVLTFRGLTFWLPLLIGFFLLHRVRSFGAAAPAS